MRNGRPSDHNEDPLRVTTARPRGYRSANIWLVLGVVAALVIPAGGIMFARPLPLASNARADTELAAASAGLAPDPAGTLKPTPDRQDGGESLAVAIAAQPTDQDSGRSQSEIAATPVVGPDEELIELFPQPRAAGWVRSNDNRNNHFSDSFLYSGVSEGEIFQGALRFDLSDLPIGAPIRYAALMLMGIDDSRLNRQKEASWEVRWLSPEITERWNQATFQDIHNAAILQTIHPPVGPSDLNTEAINTFLFNEAQLRQLEKSLIDQQTGIAFRIDGPQSGEDNLFAWDSGYGLLSGGNAPKLVIVLGAPPATPPPTPTRDYVVVTSTPTPENIFTAAASARLATAQATTMGTPTPTPKNMVTATPPAQNEATAVALGVPWVVTAVPTPLNQQTHTAMSAYATAQAITTGTWTPTPPYFMTATPTPTLIVITNTPTPGSAAALLAWAVAYATRVAREGPPTPIPSGVITATPRWIVVTSTPTPENAATAQAVRILATVAALTSGTYTPEPRNLLIATPTPAATPLPLVAVLSPTPTRTPAPNVVPAALQGKIVFRSDRLGGEQLFVMDAECAQRPGGCPDSEVGLLRDRYPYDLAQARELLSPDGYSQLFVQMETKPDKTGLEVVTLPRVMIRDANNPTAVRRLSPWEGGAYDPVWSPAGDLIAIVSTETGNDEIYVISPAGTNSRRLTFNTWEWDKHPTWSPDGKSILFYSNRDSGRRQLWLMNSDGSGQRNISANMYNDWDPVWIK